MRTQRTIGILVLIATLLATLMTTRADVAATVPYATSLGVQAADRVQTNQGSLSLDGSSAYVEIPYASELDVLDTMTIEAWVKREAYRCETIVGNGWISSYWLGFCSSAIRFYRGSGIPVDGINPLPSDQWSHVAVTYDGKTRRYYINGELDQETTLDAGGIRPSRKPLYIGADRDGGCGGQGLCFFRGLIDEVRIWNVVRTQSELQQAMYAPIDSQQSGLLAVWHLDGDATDAVGVHDGNLRGQTDFSSETSPSAPPASTDPQVLALRQLEQDSQQELFVRFDREIPRFLTGEIPLTPDAPNTAVHRSLGFLERYKDLYCLIEPRSQLYLGRIVTDENGNEHVFFGQHQGGIPVFGAELAVHTVRHPNGTYSVRGTNGNYLSEIPRFAPATVDAKSAASTALADAPKGTARVIGEPRLMILNPDLWADRESNPTGEAAPTHLVWRVTVQGARADGIGTSWTYFVSAHSGTVEYRIDHLRDHASDKDFLIESANSAANSIDCSPPSGTVAWFDESGPLPDYPGSDPDGDRAFSLIHTVYDVFHFTFGRHAWDNHDGRVTAIIHNVFPSGPNARYKDECKQLRFDNNMVTTDIVVHEYVHGVTDHTSKLIYELQPGALDESYSDVFAAMIDTDDWTIGEGSALGVLRNLESPPLKGQPDHFSMRLTLPPGVPPDCGLNDCGFVHTNSGIPNKAAYLIINGGTHNEVIVHGLGYAKTERLYYDVLTTLTQNAQFQDQRDETVSQASFYTTSPIPFGDVRDTFTDSDVCDISNAFASVGLGEPDQDCDGTPDSMDTDDDADRIPDSRDNCRTVPNPSQRDRDRDDVGDACDTDIDGDGVDNVEDNCRLTPNPDQRNSYPTPAGDACDDSDGDWVVVADDNCDTVSNPDQTNSDDDDEGDACDDDDDNDGWLDGEDNCPVDENPGQEDLDNDGVGNACDLCQDVPDPTNADTDGDEIGDVCDPDIDGDGILNQGDNCRKVWNPHQIDIDRNGRGLACDGAENQLLSGIDVGALEGLIRFPEPLTAIRIPIEPCLAAQCPDHIPETYRTMVQLELPQGVDARIVDDRGFAVSSAHLDGGQTLGFSPDADTFFRPPGAEYLSQAQTTTYQGTRYFVELAPSDSINSGQDYAIRIDVISRDETLQHLFLPIVLRSVAE